MKTHKGAVFAAVLVFCILNLPVTMVQAAQVISVDTIWSAPVTMTRDVVITGGATLTILDGVDVTASCSDSELYVSGREASKVELIVENGTLLANSVTFQGETTDACWYGIVVEAKGHAIITGSTIRDARYGVAVFGSKPTISGNTIRDLKGADQTPTSTSKDAAGIYIVGAAPEMQITDNWISNISGGSGCAGADGCIDNHGSFAYGIYAENTADLFIQDNYLGSIAGGRGGSGANGVDGKDGADGTSPTSAKGAPGEAGTPGKNAGNGGNAYAIYLHNVSAEINANQISSISGGLSSTGGAGGKGGNGGLGYTQPAPYGGFEAQGGDGGNGGAGGAGGAGGWGGDAAGMLLISSTASVLDNSIFGINPGTASSGGTGKNGGGGGGGGRGSPAQTTPTPIYAGFGGGGGLGGPGGSGGSGGDAGKGYGIASENSNLTALEGNSISRVNGALGGVGLPAGLGGVGGPGGAAGTGALVGSAGLGSGGGHGGHAGVGGNGGNSGTGSSVYGIYLKDSTCTDVSKNSVGEVTAGAGMPGFFGATSTAKGGNGGNASNYNYGSGTSGGNGGNGSSGGVGGRGGDSGWAYGIYISNPVNNAGTLVNNLIYHISGAAGGSGGIGGSGTNGGNGGNGYFQQGGNGGNGGNTGTGGEGGISRDTFGTWVEYSSTLSKNKSFTVTNNTIATVSASETEPSGGNPGSTVGLGGTGGTGTPNGTNGSNGNVGSMGQNGWQGYALGYYSGMYITSYLYNNIVVSLQSPAPGNSIGLAKNVTGLLPYSQYSNVWGWAINYQTGLGADTGYSISADPVFLDSGSKNFHLQGTSPCIDTGRNSAPQRPANDLEGTPRPLDGNADGTTTTDMGAFEYGSFYKFSTATDSVGESAGVIRVYVEHVGYMAASGNLTFSASDLTAVSPEDYYSTGGMIFFNAGVGGQQFIEVLIYEDDELEGDETFQLTLSNPMGGLLTDPSTMVITILDNEAVPVYLPLIIR